MKSDNNMRKLLDCHKRNHSGRLPVYTTAQRNARIAIEDRRVLKQIKDDFELILPVDNG
jgi:hypothetical protein